MKKISRRHFLYCSAGLLCTAMPARAFWPFSTPTSEASGSADIRGRVFRGDAPNELWKWSHEGYFYKKSNNNKVVCGICPNRCVLAPGDRSICRSKVNMDGTLYSLVYGNPCSVNIDPIEKKPLYHFKPRSKVFSIATAGCNFRCLNCLIFSKKKKWKCHDLLSVFSTICMDISMVGGPGNTSACS